MGKAGLKVLMATDADIDAIISGAFEGSRGKEPGMAMDGDIDAIIAGDDPVGKEIDGIINNAFRME